MGFCGSFCTFLLRIIQLTCTAIVLGISICAIRWQYRNSVPSTTGFTTFAGAFGCLTSLLGLLATVMDALAGWVMFVVDSLATIFLLAGGIVRYDQTYKQNTFRANLDQAYAVGLGGTDCTDPESPGTWYNRLINGGCQWNSDDRLWDCSFWADTDLVKRCHRAKVNTAFMFLGAVTSFILAILMITRRKQSGSTSRS